MAEAFENAWFSRALPYYLPDLSEHKADALVIERAERFLPDMALQAPEMEAPAVIWDAAVMGHAVKAECLEDRSPLLTDRKAFPCSFEVHYCCCKSVFRRYRHGENGRKNRSTAGRLSGLRRKRTWICGNLLFGWEHGNRRILSDRPGRTNFCNKKDPADR